MEERLQTMHPDPQKTAPRIHLWKYEAVKNAILEALPETAPGFPFKELPRKVGATLGPEVVGRLGSTTWYTTVVKLDLEARGHIARLPGVRPQSLVRLVRS